MFIHSNNISLAIDNLLAYGAHCFSLYKITLIKIL